MLRVISEKVRLRVDAARVRGEDRNICGSGAEDCNCAFQAAFAFRAWYIPFGVRRASGP